MEADQFHHLTARVALLELKLKDVKHDVSEVKSDVSEVKHEVAGVKAEVTAGNEQTNEVLDIMLAARTGFRVLGGLGIAFKWVSSVIVAGIGLYVAFRNLGGGGAP